jgi:hypothetical protein
VEEYDLSQTGTEEIETTDILETKTALVQEMIDTDMQDIQEQGAEVGQYASAVKATLSKQRQERSVNQGSPRGRSHTARARRRRLIRRSNEGHPASGALTHGIRSRRRQLS